MGIDQRMSLSPISAISAMVAPVVLITASGIFTNGLNAAYTQLAERLFRLNRERLDILGGPHGELLTEDSLPAVHRERLVQINDQTPLVIRLIQQLRNAAIWSYCAIGLLVISVIAIAVAIMARSEEFAFAALGLVLAAVMTEFAGIATVVAMVARSADALIYEATRTRELGLAPCSLRLSMALVSLIILAPEIGMSSTRTHQQHVPLVCPPALPPVTG